MPYSADCPMGRSQFLLQPRRRFLSSIFAIGTFAAKTAKPDFFNNLGKPEFWFGDMVDFRWNDEESGEPHSETGKVVGVAWDFSEKEWEYRIMWLSSTIYPAENYPLEDGNFVTAGVICKH